MREVRIGEVRDGSAQDFRLKDGSHFKQLFDFIAGKKGHNRAAMRNDRDDALGLELAQRFPDRNATDLEFLCDGVLAKLFALTNVTPHDFLAQLLGNG